MFQTLSRLLLLAALLVSTGGAAHVAAADGLSESPAAPAVAKPEDPGYYIQVEDRYYKVEPSRIRMEFGFNRLHHLNHAPVEGSPYKLVVFKPDWQPSQARFWTQRLDIVNHDEGEKLEPKITKSMNTYEVTLPELTGRVLFIRDRDGLYGIGLGDITAELERVFASTEAPAHAVVGNIKAALKSYPENEKFKELLVRWEQKANAHKAGKSWAAVTEKWKQFRAESDRDTKALLAGDIEHELDYYASVGEAGQHKNEIAQMHRAIAAFRADRQAPGMKKVSMEQLGKHVKYYRAGSYSISMVEVGQDEFLLRFRGLPNDSDGVVYRHKKAIQNDATGAYILQTTEITGENWNTLSLENSGWGGSRMFVYPPQIEQAVDVFEDAEPKHEEQPADLMRDYNSRVR